MGNIRRSHLISGALQRKRSHVSHKRRLVERECGRVRPRFIHRHIGHRTRHSRRHLPLVGAWRKCERLESGHSRFVQLSFESSTAPAHRSHRFLQRRHVSDTHVDARCGKRVLVPAHCRLAADIAINMPPRLLMGKSDVVLPRQHHDKLNYVSGPSGHHLPVVGAQQRRTAQRHVVKRKCANIRHGFYVFCGCRSISWYSYDWYSHDGSARAIRPHCRLQLRNVGDTHMDTRYRSRSFIPAHCGNGPILVSFRMVVGKSDFVFPRRYLRHVGHFPGNRGKDLQLVGARQRPTDGRLVADQSADLRDGLYVLEPCCLQRPDRPHRSLHR